MAKNQAPGVTGECAGEARAPAGGVAAPQSPAEGPAEPAPYPAELVRVVRLRNGAVVRIRPIRPDDAPRLIELYDHLSRHTAYQRFFTIMRRLPPDWAKILATVDYRRRLALVVEHDTPTGVELIGVGRYEPSSEPDAAEVAFVVQDDWQGQGLGTILLEDLLAAAAARGIERFVAFVLADNRRMLDLLKRKTDIRSRKVDSGIVELAFSRRPGTSAPPRSSSRR